MATRQLQNYLSSATLSLSALSFNLDLVDHQLSSHTTHYHVTGLNSWPPSPLTSFLTRLQLHLSNAETTFNTYVINTHVHLILRSRLR